MYTKCICSTGIFLSIFKQQYRFFERRFEKISTTTEKNLKISQQTVLNQNKSISNLELQIKNNEIEIQRLQNIKWYNKLIGKK